MGSLSNTSRFHNDQVLADHHKDPGGSKKKREHEQMGEFIV